MKTIPKGRCLIILFTFSILLPIYNSASALAMSTAPDVNFTDSVPPNKDVLPFVSRVYNFSAKTNFWSAQPIEMISLQNSIDLTLGEVMDIRLNTTQGYGAEIYHHFDDSLALNEDHILTFYWYGLGSTKRIKIIAQTNGWDDFFSYEFLDDYSGWKRVVIPLEQFEAHGKPEWFNINEVKITFQSYICWTELYRISSIKIVSPVNWVIERDTMVENKAIHMYGSIIVKKPFSLKIVNSSVLFHSPVEGLFGIVVEGSKLERAALILEDSTFSSGSGAAYYFNVFGEIYAKNSKFSNIGWQWGVDGQDFGLWLGYYSDRSRLENCTISDNQKAGLLLFNATGMIIQNSTFTNNGHNGLVLAGYSHNNTIFWSIFSFNDWCGLVIGDYAHDNTIACSKAIQNRVDGFQIAGHSLNNLLLNCASISNSMAGFAVESYAKFATIDNSSAFSNDQGFLLVEDTSYTIIKNSKSYANHMGLGIWDRSENNYIMNSNLTGNYGCGTYGENGNDFFIKGSATNNTFVNCIFDFDNIFLDSYWSGNYTILYTGVEVTYRSGGVIVPSSNPAILSSNATITETKFQDMLLEISFTAPPSKNIKIKVYTAGLGIPKEVSVNGNIVDSWEFDEKSKHYLTIYVYSKGENFVSINWKEPLRLSILQILLGFMAIVVAVILLRIKKKLREL